MKKWMNRSILLLTACLFLTACKDDDKSENYPASIEGVWSYVNGSTGYSCELIVGGKGAVTATGVYTRITVARKPGDYSVLTGGTVYDSKTGAAKVTFSDPADGAPTEANIAVRSETELVLNVVSPTPSEFPSYTLAKVKFPESLSGSWGGTVVFEEIPVRIVAEFYPYVVGTAYGKVHVTAEGEEHTADVGSFVYDAATGKGSFDFVASADDPDWGDFSCSLQYDYSKDVLKSVIKDNEDGSEYPFELSPLELVE